MLVSKVTGRSQTTLPRGVRQALGIGTGEQLGYVIEGDRVQLVNASAAEHADPALQRFLHFLGQHMGTEPGASILPFPPELLARARALTADVEIDHDAPIEGAIAL